jgi:hypothetical protein
MYVCLPVCLSGVTKKQNPSVNQNNLLSFCSFLERYRQWISPLLAIISESLTPTNPFKDVGLGRSPYQRTGQAIRCLKLPQPRSTSSHSPTCPPWAEVTFDVCPPILQWGPRVCLSSYFGPLRDLSGCLNPSWCCPSSQSPVRHLLSLASP